jgi:hypothetical protein
LHHKDVGQKVFEGLLQGVQVADPDQVMSDFWYPNQILMIFVQNIDKVYLHQKENEEARRLNE